MPMKSPPLIRRWATCSAVCLCGLLLVTGCLSWPTGKSATDKSTTDPTKKADAPPETWGPRETLKGKFGLDSRAREIERNLGVY